MRARLLFAVPALLTLAACGSNDAETEDTQGEDPAVAGALGEDIMVDPDRIDQSGEDGALAGGDPASSAVPLDEETREQVNKARDEARQLAGGSIDKAPAAGEGLSKEVVAAAQAVQRGESGVDCSNAVDYSAAWADKMPAPFAIYPRGAVTEAAGNDKQGCAMRVATFTTAVPSAEVVNYYYSRARAAGFSADVLSVKGETVLGGRKGNAAYVIYFGKGPNGRTKVDLLARGS